MKIKASQSGVYYAHVWTQSGPRRISLKTRSKADAAKNAKEAKIAELESAAKVNALTAETVTRILSGRRLTGKEAYQAWSEWAGVVGLTPNTQVRYGTYIQRFLRDSGFEDRPVASIQDTDIDRFVNPGAQHRIVVATRRNRLCALQSFFAVALSKGFTAANPAALVKIKFAGLSFQQKEGKTREPFTEAEMQKLRSLEDPFQRTLVLLGEHYGLRLSDVAQLERAALGRDTITVWTDKRDKRLRLPLVPEVRDHLHSLPVTDPVYFFPKEREIAIDTALRSKLSLYFGRAVQRLGIDGKSAHCLRHTFATRRAGLGESIDEIREKLGHSSAATTAGYVHA